MPVAQQRRLAVTASCAVSMAAVSLPLIESGLRGGFVALMLLLAWHLAHGPRLQAVRLGVCMALGAAAYAVQAPQAGQVAMGHLPAWQLPLQWLMNGNPVVMWLLACALFDDDFRLRPWHGGLWLAWVAMSLGNCVWWRLPALGLLAQSGPILFSVAALWPVLRSWRGDLVEARIRWRVRILGVIAAYSSLSALAGIPSQAAASTPWLGLLDAAALMAVGLIVAGALLRLQPGLWEQAGPLVASTGPEGAEPLAAVGTPASRPIDQDRPGPLGDAAEQDELSDMPADPGALARLQRAMADEQIFRREGLTIGALAAHLGLPEYRLRRVINRQLGHRNFNAYLNGHRIAWAQAALADPAQAGTPVLTLALDAGFQSLGPFNRAFKAATGRTPSEYRAQALAESR